MQCALPKTSQLYNKEMNYFPPENPSFFPPHNFGLMHNNLQEFQFSKFLSNFPNYKNSHQIQNFTPNSSCISNYNSTSDEADDHHHDQVSINIDERKQRRMISNRESARRSRMRKQRHLDELLSQVVRLRTENRNLVEKLNRVSESHERVVEENGRLKEEASDLRRMLEDHLQIGDSYAAIFRDLEEIPCIKVHVRAESSNLSVTANLLH